MDVDEKAKKLLLGENCKTCIKACDHMEDHVCDKWVGKVDNLKLVINDNGSNFSLDFEFK